MTAPRWRALDLARGFSGLGQVGVGPEGKVRRVLGAVGRHLVVADARVLTAEVVCPVHEGMRRGGHHDLVHAPLCHQLTARGVRHLRQQVRFRLFIAGRLGFLFCTQRKVSDGETLHLHERPPEGMAIEHSGGDQVGVGVDQHDLKQWEETRKGPSNGHPYLTTAGPEQSNV